mgnify:FL=1
MDAETERQVKAHYAEIRTKSRNSFGGLPYDQMQPSALAISAEERRRVYDERYAQGGFRLIFDSFADLLLNKEANDTVAEYIRGKIRERVTDPQIADILSPKDYPYGTKRPPLETNYYETYNRDNVTLVDIKVSPIERITEQSICTTSGEYKLDAIVLAIGFDAMTGPLMQLGIVGRNGEKLADRWANGPLTYLGITTHGFPNLFFITGLLSSSPLRLKPSVASSMVAIN